MSNKGRDIVVIGTSAGGLEALDQLVGQLSSGFPASIFIVQHMHPEHAPGGLLLKLSRHTAFHCKVAEDGDSFESGNIYLAPADAHLLVKEKTLVVTRGARENRYRPAVDPLFRSAAVAHGPHVIGVILTGMLDDGTSGLLAVHRCGGVTVVQDPSDAPYPEMPQSAINNDRVDYCLPLAQMGSLLEKLSRESPQNGGAVPDDIRMEAAIAERVLCGIDEVDKLGHPVPYACPSCGGALWETTESNVRRYRCHTGHTFTPAVLSDSQAEKIEETLWVALRMLEERKNIQQNMAQRETRGKMKGIYEKNAKEAEEHAARIRALLLAKNNPHEF